MIGEDLSELGTSLVMVSEWGWMGESQNLCQETGIQGTNRIDRLMGNHAFFLPAPPCLDLGDGRTSK